MIADVKQFVNTGKHGDLDLFEKKKKRRILAR